MGARQAWKSCQGRKKKENEGERGREGGGDEWGGGKERLNGRVTIYNDILAVTF